MEEASGCGIGKALDVDVDANNFSLSKKKAKVAGELVGAQAASWAALLDPEGIVLAGALLEADGPLWPYISATYDRFILSDIAERVPLLHSKVGPYAAALGATQQCFQELFPTTVSANQSI